MTFDNIDQRIKRYEQAKVERQLKIGKLVQAYRLAFPTHAKWLIHGKGSEAYDKTNFRWDTTAVSSLKIFASNIQTLLIPPFQQWAKLVPAPELIETNEKQMNDELLLPSKILFNALDNSNLLLEANIAFQDMGIAVGLLQIHATGDPITPIRFKSIPMHNVALGAFEGSITDVYRHYQVTARDIPAIWQDAELTPHINSMIKNDPDGKVELLEGTIYYPNNPKDQKYLYFVTDMMSKEDIVMRPMSYSRWIPFRFAVSPGEVWGEGPVMQVLDIIRIANKIVELDLLNAGLKISRPLFVNGSKVLNPNNIKIEPGALIHINDTRPGELPIVPLDIAGDFNFDQVTLERYQAEIKDALFADPLGPSATPNQSATEVSIRQKNWIKKSASSMGRLANELLKPIVHKTVAILVEQGLMPSGFDIDTETMRMTLDGQLVEADFFSPLARLDDEEEAQRFLQFNQELQAIMGPQMAAGVLNLEEVPTYLANKLDVNSKLVKGPAELMAMAQQLQEAQQQAQAAAEGPPTAQMPQSKGQQSMPVPQLNIGGAQ